MTNSLQSYRWFRYLPLFLLSWLLFSACLAGIRPLALPDEGRYGDVGRWMMQSGDWLTPRLDGLPFFHKPPLLYWLDAAAMKLLGVHPWVVRLVPLLHAWLMLTVSVLYCRRFLGEEIAWRCGIMLGSSMLLLGGADYVNCDMEVACWISVSIWSFAASLQSRGKAAVWLALAGFAASALGVLSKGLIGVVLPGLVLFVWVGVEQRWRRLLTVPWVRGWSLFALLTLPWFLLLERRYPGFFHYFFIEQQFTRYIGSGFNNRQPLLFYVACLLIFMFPFSALLRWRCPEPRVSSSWRLAWIWLLAILVFFSIPASKLVGYILPVLPALSLLAAVALPFSLKKRQVQIGIAVGSVLLGGMFGFLGCEGGVLYHWPLWLCVLGWILAVLWWVGCVVVFFRRFHPGVLGIWALQSVLTLLVVDIGVAYQTQSKSAQAVAHYLLQQSVVPQVFYWGGYPFDLPFYLNTQQTFAIFSDWKKREQTVKDDGDQQLIDGLAFEPAARTVLRERAELPFAIAQCPHCWLICADSAPNPAPNWFVSKVVFGHLAVWKPKGAGVGAGTAGSR